MKREVGSGETGEVYTPKHLSNQIGYHLFGINSGLVAMAAGYMDKGAILQYMQ